MNTPITPKCGKPAIKIIHTLHGKCLLAFFRSPALAVALFTCHAGMAAVKPPFVRVPPVSNSIVIDGKISPGEWDNAFMGTGVASYKHGGIDPMRVRYHFAYDDTNIYLAAEMETPKDAALDAPSRRLGGSQSEFRFEFLVDPKSENPDTSWVQGMFWPRGKFKNFGQNQRIGGFVPYDIAWNYKDGWKGGIWTVELSAPVTAFQRASLAANEIWGILFAGNVTSGPGYFSGTMGDSYAARNRFLKMALDPSAPIIHIGGFNRIAEGVANPEVSVRNPGEKTARYRVKFTYRTAANKEFALSFDPESAPQKTEERMLEIAPGKTERTGWSVPLPKDVTGWLTVEVASEDGRAVYYSGVNKLSAPREPKWSDKPKVAAEVLLEAHPYPSSGKMRAIVDFGGMEQPSQVAGVEFRLVDSAGKEVAAAKEKNAAALDVESLLSLPANLPEGEYTVEATLLDAKGKALRKLSTTHTHRRFAFQNNTLGISDRVLAPWTPIEVGRKQARIGVWGRDYLLGDAGFPKQILSKGEELLAAPVIIRETVNGKSALLAGSGVEFTKVSDAHVEAVARAKGRAVEAEIRLLAEYDGMLKYEVILTGRKGDRLEALDLVIPWKGARAEYLHATGDGCRSNYSHALPEGEGTVWDSSEIVNWVMPVQWIPYLWLGDTERGLCWWADSAEGWTLPKKADTPVVKIEREEDRVSAVFHLVTPDSPVLWKDESPRRIVFALEATPVRPMVSWARDIGLNDPKVTHQRGPRLDWIGSAHWATLGQEKTPYTYAYLRPVNEDAAGELRKRAKVSAQRGKNLLLYTNMRSRALVGEEEKAFAWEWNPSQEDPSSEMIRNAPHHRNIFVNSAPSRIDYDLWCFNRLMDLGARAFYFDEIQTEGQINPLAGLGYRDEDGKWMPTMRLFAYRDLWKRLYTLMQERGISEPIIVLHNTSTTYAGPMAFATATWDFEEANSDPNQRQLTRFGMDYLITEAMGHQYGFAASTLGPSPGFERWIKPGDTESERKAARHWMGIHMILNMNPYLRSHKVVEEGLGILGEFGWNEPDTEWVPYWKAGEFFSYHPGPDARQYVSLYLRGREGLLIFLNDTNEDVTVEWKPVSKLPVRGALQDAESEGKMVSAKEGVFAVRLPKFDYRAFRVSLD